MLQASKNRDPILLLVASLLIPSALIFAMLLAVSNTRAWDEERRLYFAADPQRRRAIAEALRYVCGACKPVPQPQRIGGIERCCPSLSSHSTPGAQRHCLLPTRFDETEV